MIKPKEVKRMLRDITLSNKELVSIAEKCIEQSLLGSALRITKRVCNEKLFKQVQQKCVQEERYSYAFRM